MLPRHTGAAKGPNRRNQHPRAGVQGTRVHPACRGAVEDTAATADRMRYYAPAAEMIVAIRGLQRKHAVTCVNKKNESFRKY